MKRCILLILILASVSLYGQSVSSFDAVAVSTIFFDKVFGGQQNVIDSVIPMYKDTAICLYKVKYTNGRWCLVPSTMAFAPIVAFGTSDTCLDDTPEAYNNLIESYLTEINSFIQSNITLKNSYGRSLHQELSITVTNRDVGDEQGYGDSSTIENEMYFTSLNQETGVRIDTNMCVYPNPSDGVFGLSIVDDSIVSIDVYNSKGQQVYADDNVGSSTYMLNIKNFPSDIYIINARCRHKAYNRRIIKQ